MPLLSRTMQGREVVLLAEDVDRNDFADFLRCTDICRPPRGGRG